MSDADGRPVILTLLGVFQPGFEATGPNQSLLRMAEALRDRFRFRVISMAVPGEPSGRWTTLNGIERLALQRSKVVVARHLVRAISETPHDLIVANGMFDMELTVPALVARRVGAIARTPFMVAPRGEFSPGAIGLKAGRKRAFLNVAKATSLLSGVSIQATTPQEADDIRAVLGRNSRLLLGPNIRPLPPLPPHRPRQAGEPLRVSFLSRIDRKKNLIFALDILARMRRLAHFDIYGPVSDPHYWAECQAKIAAMPGHVTVTVHGAIQQRDVLAALADSDVMLLPTLGENYGHAIVDSFSAGTPVMISDQTPWRSLDLAQAGWDLALDDPARFSAILDEVADLSAEQAGTYRAGARSFIAARLDPQADATALEQCFVQAMSAG